jgi:hypothetical protein
LDASVSLLVGAVFIFSLNNNWRIPTMTMSNTAVQKDTQANPNGAATQDKSNAQIPI